MKLLFAVLLAFPLCSPCAAQVYVGRSGVHVGGPYGGVHVGGGYGVRTPYYGGRYGLPTFGVPAYSSGYASPYYGGYYRAPYRAYGVPYYAAPVYAPPVVGGYYVP